MLSTTTMATEDSVEAKTTLPVVAKTAFIQLDLSDEKVWSLLPFAVMMPVQQEPANSLVEEHEYNLKHQDTSEIKILPPVSVFSESSSQFRPGHCDYYLSYNGSVSPIPESVTTFEDHRPLSPDSPNTQFRPGHCDYYLLYDVCRSTSPMSVTSDLEYRGLYRPDFASESEFTVTVQSSLSEYRPLSPESITSEGDFTFLELLFSESRSSSPESVASFDEYRPLSPDSPVPHFMPQCCDCYLSFTGSRCSSPESVASDIEFSEFCLEELFAEDRADSPESFISESEFVESVERGLMELRPLSPESVTSEGDYTFLELLVAESRPSSPDSITSNDQYRVLSPDSPIPQFRPTIIESSMSFFSRSSSPISVTSDVEGSGFYLEEFVNEERPYSPESFVSESEFVEAAEGGLINFRPLSPESVTSEDGYIFLELLFAESRPSSSESITSLNEYRPLSPDSPIPDFRPHCCDYYLLFTEDRSSSPQSVTSDIEFSGFSLEELIAEDRADSPELMYSDSEFLDQLEAELVPVLHESASPVSDSLPHSIQSETSINKFISPALVQSESVHRDTKTDMLSTTTMATEDSVEAKTTLPVVAKTAFIQLDLSDEKVWSLLPFAVMMPVQQEPANSLVEEHEYNLKHQDTSEIKILPPVSVFSESSSQFRPGHCDYYLSYNGSVSPIPESVTTFEDHRPLSPDSPNTQFRPGHCDYYLLYDVCRSTSPMSVTSDLEYRGLYRPDFASESEFTVTVQSSLSEYRPLSPESITSEGDFTFLELLFSESRSSSPESVASFDEYRPLSPDSPVPHFMPQCCDCYLSFTGSRCSSPESVASDIEFSEFCLEELFAEDRADSPESFISESEFVESVERGLMELRPLSPESVTSEGDYTFLELLVAESRPSSPDSITSNDQYRVLSPDSPIPQFRPTIIESSMSFFSRSSSPISVTSDVEGSGFYLEEFVNEERPYSPESFVSESEFVEAAEGGLINFRPLSPESVTSEDGYIFLELLFAESRPSSSESITSLNEYRPLSPDSPIPDFRPHCCDYYLLFTEDRSSSPQSVTSDIEFSGFSLEELIAEDRADSPESMYSDSEFLDQLEAELVPVLHESASPVSDSLPHSNQSETSINKFISPALVQFESVHRDTKTDMLSTTTMATEDSVEAKTTLPVVANTAFIQLDLSDEKVWSLLPVAVMMPVQQEPANSLVEEHEYNLKHQDKSEIKILPPVSVFSESSSQFRPGHCDYYLSYNGSVSPIPESVTTFEDHRPLSPDSPNTQFRPGHCDYYLLYDVCRSTSPMSVTSDLEYRGLYRPDFASESEFTVTVQSSLSEYRPLSPESITSEGDFTFLELLFSESRSSSPESVASFDEYRPLSPDSPVPHFMPQCCDCYLSFTGSRCSSPESVASDIEFSEFCLEELFAEDRADSPESFISESEFVESVERGLMELRPLSPESVTSEGDYTFLELLVAESRPSSPDSITSNDQYRALSPDSPIPQFRPTIIESAVSFFSRSSSPISVTSDTEGSGFYLEELFNEERPDSPESFVSEREFIEAAEGVLMKYRPLSPESETSVGEYSFIELLFAESRPSSLESVTSFDEYRPLSPDSPVPHFVAQCCHCFLSFTGSRCSSPESVTSDIEFSGLNLEELFIEDRPDSPISLWSEGGDDDVGIFPKTSEWEYDAGPPEMIPTVHWTIIPQFMVSKAVQTGLSLESLPQPVHELSEVRPVSPEYRLVYRAVPIKLMSHTYDPAKEGETYYGNSGVFEHSGQRYKVRQVLDCQREHCGDFRPVQLNESNLGMPSISETTAVEVTKQDISSLKHFNITDQTVTETLHKPHLQISQPVSTEIRTPSPILAEWEFTQLSSLPEYRPLSLESLGSDMDGIHLYLDHLFTDMRPSSPESVASVNEYRPLSPDSPVPHYGPRIPDVTMTAERRSSLCAVTSDIELFGLCLEESFAEDRADSPESVTSHVVFSEFCLDESFAEDRADSPESFISEGEYEHVHETLTKSSPLPPEDEYARSFVQYWLSELQPSSAEPMISLDELDAADTSPSTEIEDSESQPVYEFSEGKTSTLEYRLVYKAVPSTLMAHTFDPAYQGETFLNKPGVFEYARDRQAREIMERLKDKDIFLDRPVTPESITSEEIQSFLNDWSTELRPNSPASVASLDEHRPLSPDSPIPQFLHQCCDYYVELPGDRSSSPQSVTSGVEYCGLYVDELIPEHRPDSPDSFLADSEFRESIEQFFMKFRTLSPESETSVDGYSFFKLLFVESRPSSPESVTSFDEYRPLSPDSPIPQFLHQYCDYYVLFPADRSSSPESVTSDIEFSEFCLDELFAEERADSPESFISEGEYEHVDETHTKSSPLPPEDEYARSFVQYWLSELQPSSAEPMISLNELDAAETSPSTEIEDSESQPIYEFSEEKTSTPEYRLVYKAVPSTLMAHTFVPAYKGDTYFSKTGVFEYETGDRQVRKVLDQSHQSSEDLRPVSVEEPASPCHSATPAEEETVQEGSLLTVPHVTDQTVTETLHEPHLPISQPVSTEIRTPSPVLAEWEFTQLSSLPEYRPLSPESLGSDRDGVLLYLDHLFTDMRPSSPESVVSFDEYRPLSPDSPVPHFMPKCCNYYFAPTDDRSSSPQSVTSDIEFSEFCLEELFAEDRADSPESLISEDGMRLEDESDKDKSQDRPMTPDSTSGESLSFLEDWFSELDLRPSSAESVLSQEEYRHLSPDSPVLQYGPGLSVFAVSSGEKCWTPESVISDWDEFGLEDLLCATRACSPDSVCSNTDTVLTDGQHSPPIDQVSTEHEPEMRVERARLKQPPEIIGAPFSLVFPVVCQTHRAVEAFFCRASSPDSHREPVEDVDLDWLDDVETHRPHQASSQSSHVLSDEQNLGSPVAAVRAEEAVHERPQASCKSIQRKEHSNVPTLKGSEVQPKIDETSKRKPMRKAEDSRVSAPSVSAVSSMENLSEPKHVLALDQPSTNRPISNKTLMSETQSVTPDLQIPNAFEFSPLSPEMTMPTEKMRVSPESPEKPLNLNKESSSSETSPVLPDLLSHNSEDSQGDEPQCSATNLQTPLESGAPAELDQLQSEFEEIKPEFRPETLEPLDSPLSESSEVGLEDLQPYVEFEDLLPESDGNPTEGEEEISSLSPSSPIQITGETAEISVVASVPTDLSLSYETDPEVFGVTTDLIKTLPEPSQVTADPVQLSHLEYLQTHRAEKSDLNGSISLVSPTAATKSVRAPESPESCHKVLELSSESIVPSQKFQSLAHDDAAVFTEPSTVEELRISLPQQDQETVDEEYDNSKETSSIQAAVKKASIEQSKVLCESGGLTTEPSQLVDETCMSNTPEVVSHLRDSTPPETLEYDEQSPQSRSEVTPQTPETVTAYRSHLRDSTPPETLEYDEQSPQLLSDVTPQTPETVTVSRHFSFEELIPYQSPRYLNMLSEELKPNTSEQPSENPVTPIEEEFSPPVTPVEVKSHDSQPSPVDPMAEMVSAQPDPVEPRAEMVSAQPGPVEPRAEMVSAQPVPEVTASAHDEEFFMEFSLPPEYAEASSSIHKPKPPAYAEVIRGSTTMHLYEDSDPETYFDCKQGVSDFFETEPDEPKKRERSGVGRTQGQASHSGALGRKYQKPTALPGCSAVRKHERGVQLSSGSEDYEDAPYDDIKEESEELAQSPGTHRDDSAFYQAPQELRPLRAADDDDFLDREVAVEVGEMTSDVEEFLTSRVVRRRVIIQQDEMTDIPPQTVTEEHYTDQHGHTVVRKVTRKVNRQVMSSEGSQREEVRAEGGAPPGEEGDGYSRVVERTVLRSHRDHSEVRVELGAPPEVTFSERDSDSVWGEEESAEGREVSRVERNAVGVEGDWTETQHGDPTLTSDLPTARDDFTQGQDV
ncbi:uncharacterized protein LOC115189395 isoform X2 [Salmo trutta]|uniref:uncharacterized protein LOC115189395 isoform X2 n=1 Tax=Salmo trutta TaxID=8032 RepID=UPI001130E9FD|nr:uncharacterized protein LOC115189395 isoform X2 [Salmo trutta]